LKGGVVADAAEGRKPDNASWLWSPWLAFGLVSLVRAGVFPFAWNIYGDAPSRVEILLEWMAHPFFLRSFHGARQYGPLNLYLLAALEWLWPDRFVVPRLLSLALGCLSAWPFYRLAERRFGRRAAAISTWAFALYGLHIQSSTTAASEAIFLFFLLWALVFLDREQLAAAAVAVACCCAVRYDGWLYAPLSWLFLVGPVRSGRVSLGRALAYAAGTLVVPVFLMWGNWRDMGDPLYLVHYIDADHMRNAAHAAAAIGRKLYAVYCLTFWPANLFVDLTPAVFAAVGIAVWRCRRTWRALDLAVLATIPAALFSFRGAFLLQFHPLARFTIPTAVLLLPYAGPGFELLLEGRRRAARIAIIATSVVVTLAVPAIITWRTEGKADAWADTLRPVSPVSNLPPDLEAGAKALETAIGSGNALIDQSPGYEDIALAFYVHLPFDRVWELRRPGMAEDLEHRPAPDVIAEMPGGRLEEAGFTRAAGDGIDGFGRHYRLAQKIGRVSIYVRPGL
jgi:hypothetical protein